jgi:hypothetical protein
MPSKEGEITRVMSHPWTLVRPTITGSTEKRDGDENQGRWRVVVVARRKPIKTLKDKRNKRGKRKRKGGGGGGRTT